MLLFCLADGYINLGGGEKDSAITLWRRGWPVGRSLVRSALVAVAGLLIAGAVLAMTSTLGMAGRQV